MWKFLRTNFKFHWSKYSASTLWTALNYIFIIFIKIDLMFAYPSETLLDAAIVTFYIDFKQSLRNMVMRGEK